MKEHYLFRCSNCDNEYSVSEIEDHLLYICPKCGSNKKNKPLSGVLEVVYDYGLVKSNISKEAFLRLSGGKIWEYPYLWPLDYDDTGIVGISSELLNKLSLSANNIYGIEYEASKLKIFDDSRNPTLSYKDRASILVALKALQLGITEISAASTGNAGSSLAGICARLGIESHIFVPKNIPSSKRIQIQSFGANLYVVDGDYDEAFDLCLDISKKKNWYNRNTAYNPLTIEGKKSSVFDMFIELKGKLPEYIFVPSGDGVIISGIYKGLKELKLLGWIDELPKLVAVQAEGSDAIVRYFESNKFEFEPAQTIADSINAGAPRNLFMAVDSIKKTNGYAVRVSDNEIMEAQKELSSNYGILSEPAAAASFAGYVKLRKTANKGFENSMLMITGNGLKDISSLETWNYTPEIKSFENWKKYLL